MKKLSVLVATVIVAMGASFTSLLVSAQVPVIRKT